MTADVRVHTANVRAWSAVTGMQDQPVTRSSGLAGRTSIWGHVVVEFTRQFDRDKVLDRVEHRGGCHE